MNKRQLVAWCIVAMVVSAGAAEVAMDAHEARVARIAQVQRKFAEKPNAMKKVALDDIDADLQTNSVQDSGFSWSNMLAMVMQMLFNGVQSPTKSDSALDADSGVAPSPWASLLTVGLKILTAVLGGATGQDNIDKVDNGSSPMQGILAAVLTAVLGARDPDQVASMAKQAGEFINIVVNLLDALKTSFSHRSLAARSGGQRDTVSDAALASLAMLKGYARTVASNADPSSCSQMHLCEANRECVSDIGPNSVLCQLGTYAAGMLIAGPQSADLPQLYEAARRGRSSQHPDCRRIYHDCNEI